MRLRFYDIFVLFICFRCVASLVSLETFTGAEFSLMGQSDYEQNFRQNDKNTKYDKHVSNYDEKVKNNNSHHKVRNHYQLSNISGSSSGREELTALHTENLVSAKDHSGAKIASGVSNTSGAKISSDVTNTSGAKIVPGGKDAPGANDGSGSKNASGSKDASGSKNVSGITEREATFKNYWDSRSEQEAECHPSCFCEFPDQATCIGPRITFIPTRLNSFLTLLEIVDASLLSIRTDSFHSYPHLKHLSLINCSVVKLEAFAFRGLAGLKTLNFNLNPLTHLSRYSFSGIFNVRVLNLTENNIKRIHSLAFESSSFVGKLLLQRNPLSHISARAFLGLSHVESLVISESFHPTPVATLEPDAFWGLDDVKDLYLDGIPATRLTPFSFRGLANVAHLYLRKTKVAVIEPHAFSGLLNVAYLHMDESRIRHIQATAFSEMTNVSYVDLSKNQLYELSPESLDGIDGVVEHLDLMENPWHCNCSIHWMRKAANHLDHVTTLTRSMMSLRCHTPPEMRGRYLAQLDDRVMRCPTVAVERRVRQGEDPPSTAGATSSAGVFRGGLTTTSPLLLPALPWASSPLPWLSSPSTLPTRASTLQLPSLLSLLPLVVVVVPASFEIPSIPPGPFSFLSLFVIINTWSTTLSYSEIYSTVFNYHRILTYCSWRVFVTILSALFYNRVLSFYGNAI